MSFIAGLHNELRRCMMPIITRSHEDVPGAGGEKAARRVGAVTACNLRTRYEQSYNDDIKYGVQGQGSGATIWILLFLLYHFSRYHMKLYLSFNC